MKWYMACVMNNLTYESLRYSKSMTSCIEDAFRSECCQYIENRKEVYLVLESV